MSEPCSTSRRVPWLATACLAAACVVVGACGGRAKPAGQILLHVDTDAPLPSRAGSATDARRPAPLFDRIWIDVYPPGADAPCADCTQDATAYREDFEEGVSFGIVPTSQSGSRVRVRLYRSVFLDGAEPLGRTALDVTVELPAVGADGIVDGTVVLETDHVGVPVGTPGRPAPWTPGRPASSRVGTWPDAIPRDCVGEPRDREVCVPGGAFWMSNLLVTGGSQGEDVPVPRLVSLAPFFLDQLEVTVGAYRASGLASLGNVQSDGVTPSVDPTSRPSSVGLNLLYDAWHSCQFPYDPNDGAQDAYPLNCISYDRAREYCWAVGADLPTEAQIEYVSGALRSQLYVWGSDEPSCDDAVFGRGSQRTETTGCLGPVSTGPEAPGSARRDRLQLPTGTIVDLAGNVAELARDAWAPQSFSFWAAYLQRNPDCQPPACGTQSPDGGTPRTVRGGSWADAPLELMAAYRTDAPDPSPYTDQANIHLGTHVGFRCARSAE
jgi:formylglycine-generating enzyme required for sulfatase activity